MAVTSKQVPVEGLIHIMVVQYVPWLI